MQSCRLDFLPSQKFVRKMYFVAVLSFFLVLFGLLSSFPASSSKEKDTVISAVPSKLAEFFLWKAAAVLHHQATTHFISLSLLFLESQAVSREIDRWGENRDFFLKVCKFYGTWQTEVADAFHASIHANICLLYTSPSPRD